MHPLTSYICSPFPSYICAPLFLPKFVPLFLPKFVPLFLPKFVPLCIPNCVPLFLPRFVPLFLPRFVPLFLSFMRLCLHFHSMHLLNQTFQRFVYLYKFKYTNIKYFRCIITLSLEPCLYLTCESENLFSVYMTL